MMNRIILIGNGFDLAHGLRTSYANFIDYYWENWVKLFAKSNKNSITDRLATFTIRDKRHRWRDAAWGITYNKTAAETLEFIRGNKDAYEIKYTPFFEMINKAVETKGWIDIENEFYFWLKKVFKKDNCEYDSPIPLNVELELIKEKLVEYLKSIEEQIKPELVKDCIRNVIYGPFNINDISNQGQSIFREFVMNRWNTAQRRQKRTKIYCQ